MFSKRVSEPVEVVAWSSLGPEWCAPMLTTPYEHPKKSKLRQATIKQIQPLNKTTHQPLTEIRVVRQPLTSRPDDEKRRV
mmetsp:Transcript_8057/g.13346  ORF Transcript_8057/g.13346 Transcript_8057/m.13346 type:complete len:80 (-) Transcript_8057:66-305(-)